MLSGKRPEAGSLPLRARARARGTEGTQGPASRSLLLFLETCRDSGRGPEGLPPPPPSCLPVACGSVGQAAEGGRAAFGQKRRAAWGHPLARGQRP